MGKVVRGDTIYDEERIKLLNKIIAKLKEIEESIPVKIRQAIDALVDNSPEAYDTLKELYEGLILQPDWEQSDNTKLDFIKNKPTIPEQVKSDWDESDNTKASYIENKPTIPDPQVQSDLGENDSTKKSYIQNRTHYVTKETDFVSGQIEFKRNSNESTFDLYIDGVLKEENVNIEQCAIEIYTTPSDLSGGWGGNTYQWFNFPLHYDSAQDSIYYTIRSRNDFTKSGTNPIIYSTNTTPGTSRITYPKTTFHKLDERYIPDSLIQRIEACEQALNITPNP